MSRHPIFLAATACFLIVQLAVISSVVVQGNRVLSRGVECRFKVTGYDPSDVLRGRYVQFTPRIMAEEFDGEFLQGRHLDRAYFQLSETPDPETGLTQVLRCAKEPSPDGVWIGPLHAWLMHSLAEGTREGETLEDYLKRYDASPEVVCTDLLENKFYVPEKEAPVLEERLRQPGASAVAVYRAYKGHILLEDLQVTP